MIDTRNKRAAALGFGLASLLVLPAAEGALTVESAGHALSAYRYDLADLIIVEAEGDEILLPQVAREIVLPAETPRLIMLPSEAHTILLPRRRAL